MITLPGSDYGRNWQTAAYLGKEPSFQLMNGIVLYSVDRQHLRYKGATHVVRAQGGGGRQVKVARLQWPGNWDPEPAGWRRLAAILANQQQAAVTTEAVTLGQGKLDPAVYPVAHMTGTGAFTFTPRQTIEMKKYIAKGGVIVCDAAGGDPAFANSAEAQLTEVIAGSKFSAIMPEDPVLAQLPGTDSSSFGTPMIAPPPMTEGKGAPRTLTTPPPKPGTGPTTKPAVVEAPAEPEPVKTVLLPDFPVTYRNFAKTRLGSSTALRLKGIKFRQKYAIIFSAEDLSTGMVGQQVDGVHGYSPMTATEIMRRLVMNLSAPPAAPTAPPTPTAVAPK
jgi:hypothetical protein